MKKYFYASILLVIILSSGTNIYGQDKSEYEILSESLKQNKFNAERIMFDVRELYQDSLMKISKVESAYQNVKQSHNTVIDAILFDIENNQNFQPVKYETRLKELDEDYLAFHNEAMLMINAKGANISFVAFLAIAIEILNVVYNLFSERQALQQQQQMREEFNMLKIN